MKKGTVKWFNPKKGYGFISPEEEGKDVFVHISAVHASNAGKLFEGDRVEFDVEERDGKVSVSAIKKLEQS